MVSDAFFQIKSCIADLKAAACTSDFRVGFGQYDTNGPVRRLTITYVRGLHLGGRV